ncbi:MAG: hypothetical protein KF893_04650 [Caldilineaceae bacterium]|nr:hypothetical protein [Caldilineaceae bacterium]
MNHTNGTGAAYIERMVIERKPDIITAALQAGRTRAAATAQQLTRKGAMAASAELLNECVTHLIELCYQVDGGGLCNIDERGGGVLLIPTPWGRSYRDWGLRRTEGDVLALVMSKLQTAAAHPPLFVYEPATRKWAVNIDDYPTKQHALSYWTKYQLDAASYRLLLTAVQDKRTNST